MKNSRNVEWLTDEMAMKQAPPPVLAIAVDLIPLKPGGANGGHKPAILSMLAEATRQMDEEVVWVFLTNTATHDEVKALARPRDILVCLEQIPGSVFKPEELSIPVETKLIPRPKNLVKTLGVDLLYCPFGATHLHVDGVPTVAFIADLLHLDYPETLTVSEIVERESYISHSVQVASMIQCNSRSGVERIMARYQVQEEKLFHTYLPVHVRLETDNAPHEDFVRGLGIETNYFFYPANLWKHKNHATLLLAYRLYREKAGEGAWDLVLTFHEDGSHAPLRELIHALGISSHVHCPGYVPEAGLRALWLGAGALVFPSLHEGFGIPLVEAMYYGVPIVTGWDFSLKEIAGDACHRVDSRKPESIANGLVRIGSDSALRQELAGKGKERLAFFDLSVETAKLVAVFRALPGQRDGFPRKPKVLEEAYALAVPTPASDELWTVEFSVNPQWEQNRYSIYLDDAAFGSYSCSPGGLPGFCFPCCPLGRTLRIVISPDRTSECVDAVVCEDAINQVVALGPSGQRLVLFSKQKELPV